MGVGILVQAGLNELGVEGGDGDDAHQPLCAGFGVRWSSAADWSSPEVSSGRLLGFVLQSVSAKRCWKSGSELTTLARDGKVEAVDGGGGEGPGVLVNDTCEARWVIRVGETSPGSSATGLGAMRGGIVERCT